MKEEVVDTIIDTILVFVIWLSLVISIFAIPAACIVGLAGILNLILR